jgi:hypothetical protein
MPRCIRSDHQHPSISAYARSVCGAGRRSASASPGAGRVLQRLQLLVQGRAMLELGHLDQAFGEQAQRHDQRLAHRHLRKSTVDAGMHGVADHHRRGADAPFAINDESAPVIGFRN